MNLYRGVVMLEIKFNKRFEWKDLPSLPEIEAEAAKLAKDINVGETLFFREHGVITSPMGCRAFLSPWFERGGMEPADENDKPVFVGRFNIGAVSLHLHARLLRPGAPFARRDAESQAAFFGRERGHRR